MTEAYRLRHKLIRRELPLTWLIQQFRRLRLPYTSDEIQDVFDGVKTDAEAKTIFNAAMRIIDDYDRWENSLSVTEVVVHG